MLRQYRTTRLLVALLLACAGIGTALAGPAATASRPTRVIPDISPWADSDGNPGAAAWDHAAHFAVDNEIQPGRNQPAPVPTTVAVGYTRDALWLHFVARDPNPDAVRFRYRRHDQFDNDDDYVGIIFSPFNDTQWGYEFFCSAGGTELDSFRQQGNEYNSFDAIWYCNAAVTPDGYTVTMEIPFSSVKFPHSGRPQTWRLLLFRNWARSVRHQIDQVRFDYNSNCTLCQAELVRTATPIEAHGANVQIIPEATISRTDTRATPSSPLKAGSPKASGGVDVRWAIRPDLELSATVNPNFSQVAPDVLQPTINQRFALYYPENRPFFEEGTWVFNTPGFNFGQFGGNNNRFVDTRQVADPHWATKVVGQVGNHAIGALFADDSITNILLPGELNSTLKSFDFSTRDALLRYRYDFAGHSSLGVLATGRQGGGYDNSVLALDGTVQLDPSDSITVQTARSTTYYPQQVASAFGIAPGSVNGTGWALSLNRQRTNYVASLSLGHVDRGFRSDLGYLPQVGYSEVRPYFEYDWYSHTAWWNNGGFGGSWDWVKAVNDGPVLDRQAEVYTFVHAVAQSHLIFFARHEDQYVAGQTFALNHYEFDASAQPVQWLAFEVDTTGGDGVDYVGARKGGLLSIEPSFTLSVGSHLKVEFAGDYERLNIPAGRLYTANLYDLRIAWYFNSRMFVRAIGQEQNIRRNKALYPSGVESHSRSLATQWLFGYVLTPWTKLFAGFTNGYLGVGDAGFVQQGRTYFLKLSYDLAL
ncbi:MAG TPA: DUF5916 domain-containing protein [Gammaproteobacteria bacterium]|nr:DUF5916 domain-containing protein [Gammaproteobacteria bacterium]